MPALLAMLVLSSTAVSVQAANSAPDRRRRTVRELLAEHDGAPETTALQPDDVPPGLQALASFSADDIDDASTTVLFRQYGVFTDASPSRHPHAGPGFARMASA